MGPGTSIVAIVAIIAFTVIQIVKYATRKAPPPPVQDTLDRVEKAELIELRERIKVLERIAADSHSLEAQESRRISAEIERLRHPED